jgi:hypothetical protein
VLKTLGVALVQPFCFGQLFQFGQVLGVIEVVQRLLGKLLFLGIEVEVVPAVKKVIVYPPDTAKVLV